MQKGKFFKLLKRSLVVLLCAVLLFVCVISSKSYKVNAEPITVSAIGIAALVSFLGASGIALSSSGFNNSSEFANNFGNVVNQYEEETGAPSWEQQIKSKDALNWYYNQKVGDAFVSMGETATNWALGFRNWFTRTFGLTDSGDTVIFNDTSIKLDGVNYPYYPNSSVFTNGKVPASIVPIAYGSNSIIKINNDYSFKIIIGEPYEYYGTRLRIELQLLNSSSSVVGSFSHIYASDQAGSFDFVKIYLSQWNNRLCLKVAPDDWGGYTVDNYRIDTSIVIGDNMLENIGLSGSLTDGYADFEQALEEAKTDAGEKGQVAIGAGEVAVDRPYTSENVADAVLNNTIANTGEGVLVGGYADEKEVEEETDAERVPSAVEVGSNVVLVDGLEDFFPFCIPFDLIAIIEQFNVAPEAPVIHWNMSFAGLFSDEELVLDFSGWETAAMIFRTCCLIGFCIFLILKTRDLIRG